MVDHEKDAQEFRDAYPVSPSQIETARLCWRKWGLDKLDKVPRPANKHAQRGTDAHAVLEAWMKDGKTIDTDTDIGKIVSSGLRFLPRPGSHLTEFNFTFRTPNATYRGVKDLKGKLSESVSSVWDHKTTTSFNWLKGPEKLRQDPQANIYAMSEIVEASEHGLKLERVEQNWIYYLADPTKPQSRKVQLHVLAGPHVAVPECPKEVNKDHFGFMYFDELRERFVEIEETSSQILEYRRQYEEGEIKGSQLPYNAASCGAFGGCPYANKACNLTVGERIESMEKQLSLQEKMKLAKERQAAAAGVATSEEKLVEKSNGKPVASAPKVSEKAVAAVTKIKDQAARKQELPATNPPEHANGVDPDEPKNAQKSAMKVSSGDRMEMVARAMEGILSSGALNTQLFSLSSTRDAVETVAGMSIQIADAVIAELSRTSK